MTFLVSGIVGNCHESASKVHKVKSDLIFGADAFRKHFCVQDFPQDFLLQRQMLEQDFSQDFLPNNRILKLTLFTMTWASTGFSLWCFYNDKGFTGFSVILQDFLVCVRKHSNYQDFHRILLQDFVRSAFTRTGFSEQDFYYHVSGFSQDFPGFSCTISQDFLAILLYQSWIFGSYR